MLRLFLRSVQFDEVECRSIDGGFGGVMPIVSKALFTQTSFLKVRAKTSTTITPSLTTLAGRP